MTRKDRLDIAKVVVAPCIALFVAVVGWVLTSQYNTTQLDVAARRSDADIEIARINAAMRYMELVRDLPDEAAAERRHAVAIAAPVLPPDLAFRLGIDQLPDDTDALDALMHKYGSEAFIYLARHLEVPFREIRPRLLEPFPKTHPLAKQPSELEGRASRMLRYLRERGQSTPLFSHLVSQSYENDEFRPIALLLYFDDYRSSLRDDVGHVMREAYVGDRVEEEFRSYLRDPSLPDQAKQSIAFAAAVVFGCDDQYHSDVFIREAAARFWEGVDLARGATPVEGSLQAYLFERRFHYYNPFGTVDWCRGEAVNLASASLRDAIRRTRLSRLTFDNVRLILYGYATSLTVAGDRAYLNPPDVVEVMQVVLKWANTPERRKDLSMELGSLGGHHVFLNMLPSSQPKQDRSEEDDRACCAAARAYAELLIDWYGRYHNPDWFIPEFFHDVANEFPELENRINRQAWGLGKAWPLDTSRGCRR